MSRARGLPLTHPRVAITRGISTTSTKQFSTGLREHTQSVFNSASTMEVNSIDEKGFTADVSASAQFKFVELKVEVSANFKDKNNFKKEVGARACVL